MAIWCAGLVRRPAGAGDALAARDRGGRRCAGRSRCSTAPTRCSSSTATPTPRGRSRTRWRTPGTPSPASTAAKRRARAFADAWRERTGRVRRRARAAAPPRARMRSRTSRCRRARCARPTSATPRGSCARTTRSSPRPRSRARRKARRAWSISASPQRRFRVWEDPAIVAFLGANLVDGGYARIGPVYTPREHRGPRLRDGARRRSLARAHRTRREPRLPDHRPREPGVERDLRARRLPAGRRHGRVRPRAAMTPRLYVDGLALAPGATLALPDAAAHHALRVLRLRAGDALTLFDGTGGEWRGDARGRRAARRRRDRRDRVARRGRARVAAGARRSRCRRSRPTRWTTRCARRSSSASRRSCRSSRCARRARSRGEKRVEHWRRIAIAACEQCGRNRIPPIAAPQPLAAWLAQRERRPRASCSRRRRRDAGVAPRRRRRDRRPGRPGRRLRRRASSPPRRAPGLCAVALGPRVLQGGDRVRRGAVRAAGAARRLRVRRSRPDDGSAGARACPRASSAAAVELVPGVAAAEALRQRVEPRERGHAARRDVARNARGGALHRGGAPAPDARVAHRVRRGHAVARPAPARSRARARPRTSCHTGSTRRLAFAAQHAQDAHRARAVAGEPRFGERERRRSARRRHRARRPRRARARLAGSTSASFSISWRAASRLPSHRLGEERERLRRGLLALLREARRDPARQLLALERPHRHRRRRRRRAPRTTRDDCVARSSLGSVTSVTLSGFGSARVGFERLRAFDAGLAGRDAQVDELARAEEAQVRVVRARTRPS